MPIGFPGLGNGGGSGSGSGGGGTGTANQLTVTQANTFAANNVIYNNNGTWALAQANALSTSFGLGVVSAATGSNFTVVLGGQVTLSALAANTLYYLSDITAGLLTSTAPTAVTSFVVPVLSTGTTTAALVDIGPPASLALIPVASLATSTALAVANAQSGTSYTLVLADGTPGVGAVTMNNASANTLTVPTNASVAFPIGTQIVIEQLGAGLTTVAAAGGVTINSSSGFLGLGGQYSSAALWKTGTDTWSLLGVGIPTAATTSVIAAGTVYTMTSSTATVTFGTTNPSVTLTSTGTYSLSANIQPSLVGATYAASQSATFSIFKSNNTSATIAGSTFSTYLPVVTTTTDKAPSVTISNILYATTATSDTVTIQAVLSALPSAGSVTVSSATVTAIWIHP